MKMIGKILGGSTLLMTVFLMPAQFAISQEATGRSASAAIMEEIVISAQRRESRLQETALSVVGVTGEAMRARGITNTKDIGEMAANLQLKEPDRIGQNRIHIRGIGGGTYNPIAVFGTGMYIDGHYLPGMVGNQMSTLEVERVEVLRGPQGTLFGKNVTGGAVNIISKKPHEEFEGQISASVAEYGTMELTGVLNLPFSDNVYGRFSIATEETDGFFYNRNLREYNDWRDNKSYRAAVRWQPSENWTLDFAATRYDAEGGQNGVQCVMAPRQQVLDALETNGYGDLIDEYGWEATPEPEGDNAGPGWGGRTWNPNANGGLGIIEFIGAGATAEFYEQCAQDSALGDYVNSSDLRPVSWEETEGFFLTTRWDSLGEVGVLDNLAITLNAGKRSTEHGWVIDLDYTDMPIFAIGHTNAHLGATGLYVDTESFELLADLTINEKASLLVGANYFDDTQNTGDGSCIDAFFSEYQPNIADNPGLEVPCGPSVGQGNSGVQFDFIGDNAFFFLDENYENVDTNTESKALFAHLTYRFNDDWELALGSRYTRDTRSFSVVAVDTGATFSEGGGPGSCPDVGNPNLECSMPVISEPTLRLWNRNSSDFSAVTSMISLTRHFENSMVYGLISEGYLTGSFNDELNATQYPALEPIADYDPEYVTNFELGYKGTLFDGRLLLNADIFYMDYTDKHEELSLASPLNDPDDPTSGFLFGFEEIEAVVNAGEVDVKGIELEARATPWENGFLTLDLGTLDMEYKTFDVPNVSVPGADDIEIEFLDYTQRHIHNRTPDYTLNVTLGHSFFLGNGATLTPAVSMYRQDGYEWAWDSLQFPFTPPFEDAPRSACYQDDYSKYRARVNYVPQNERWEAALFGSNITNERVIYHCQWNRGGAIKRGYEAPASWGIEFKAFF